MEGVNRKPFQGVSNIIRFNWHFYAIALALIVIISSVKNFLPPNLSILTYTILTLALFSIIISLSVSYYIYDHSNLYSFEWLQNEVLKGEEIVNINAGFDETSAILAKKFPTANLKVLDFYDPIKHTEISIERARKAYPAFPRTQVISTDNIPLRKNSIDRIFLILSAHEIRDNDERIYFFKQLNEALHVTGKIILVEHIRDLNNFLAFNFGFFHFLSKRTWRQNFLNADLALTTEFKVTPFISVFILQKNGTAS